MTKGGGGIHQGEKETLFSENLLEALLYPCFLDPEPGEGLPNLREEYIKQKEQPIQGPTPY